MNRTTLFLSYMLLTTATLLPFHLYAQSVGINTTTPDASAALDVSATNKGMLVPRLTTSQRTTISNPATGLLVFDNTTGSFWFYSGTAWTQLVATADNLGNHTATANLQLNTHWISGDGDNEGIQVSNSGLVGIGTATPAAGLDIVSDQGVLAMGTFGNGTLPATGPGARMMWYSAKSAFRAGAVDEDQWDDANIGNYSFATGYGSKAVEETSFAAGSYSTASGYAAAAFGSDCIAAGDNAFAAGSHANASGQAAVALGTNNTASGDHSIAMGNQTGATGSYSLATGIASLASGFAAAAIGFGATASGFASVALGYQSVASGDHSAAVGEGVTAKSSNEIVVGTYNTSYTPVSATLFDSADRLFTVGNGTASFERSDALVVLKSGNTGIGTALPTQKLDVNGITKTTGLQITNGANTGYVLQSDMSGNASWVSPATITTSPWTVFGSDIYNTNTGGVGIGTSDPVALLHVSGSTLLNTGTFGSSSALSISSTGTRMFFYPRKAAFRAGYAQTSQWDDANIGNYSIALGNSALASSTNGVSIGNHSEATAEDAVALGYYSRASGSQSFAVGEYAAASGKNATALGYFSTASGEKSFAAGHATKASGNNATALGYFSEAAGQNSFAAGEFANASGLSATAVGQFSTASGNNSFAANQFTTAKSFTETVFGHFNTSYTPVSTTEWNTADRLFSIGNGTSGSSTSDALVVLKSGNTGIGVSLPANKLEVDGKTKTTTLQVSSGAMSGYVLQGDASGNATWVDPASLTVAYTETDPQVGATVTNKVPKWNGTTLTDGLLYDNGTNVGIGTTTPNSALEVAGAIAITFKTALVAGTTQPDATGGIWRYSSGTGTITLPAASTCRNRVYTIINQTGSTRTISTYRDLSTTPQTTLTSSVALWIISDGTEWWQIK